MTIIGSAIKTKNDVVACISVIKNYEDRNKRKIFIGNSTRSIFVKIKFMNSEDHRFVVVSDNITDEMLENIKRSINDYKERSTLFEEMSNFQFCEHIRAMLAHAFMIESEFDYLRNTDQIREYFGLVHKKSSWKINWKPSDEPLQIIKDTVDKTFTVQLSNDFPMSADKSAAYLRRLEFIRCDYQLITDESELGPNSKMPQIELDQAWFNAIRSDRAAQYLIESLLIRSQRIRETGEISPKSDQMKAMLTLYSYENNSALAFYEEFGAEQIIGRTVKEIKEKYRSWCEENDLTVMKKKFIETLESRGLKRSRVSFRNMSVDSEQFSYCYQTPSHRLMAWQYANASTNARYFEDLHANLHNSEDSISKSKSFSISQEDQELINHVVIFIQERLSEEEFDHIPVAIVKDRFDEWCNENEIGYVTSHQFNKIIENYFSRHRENLTLGQMSISEEQKTQYRKEGKRTMSSWVRN